MICIGVLIVLAGIIPLLGYSGVLPKAIPYQGTGYSIIVVSIGVLALVYAGLNITMMGFAKIVAILIAVMAILGGVLPLATKYLPKFIPTSGPLYAGLIIVIGGIGIVYGMLSIG
ncbi:MAG: hypothetical protein KJ601_02600 [Nanoarchaeota archaeon]|nr:hypothetical protein [Nanoarchaeota archaeon]